MDVGQSSGIVEVNQDIPDSFPATFTVKDDESIRLEAIPPEGYYFTNWTGDISGTNNPITIMLNCNKNITANFGPIMHDLIIDINGNGSSSPGAGKHSYIEGTLVSIAATPDDGWHFDGWTGDIQESDTASTLLIMESDKTITANFSESISGWWLIAGIPVIGVVVWWLVKKRTVLYRIILKRRSIIK